MQIYLKKYPLRMRILHHIIAILIITLLAVGLYMTSLDKQDANRSLLYTMHKTFGWFVLWLVVIRFFVKMSKRPHFEHMPQPWHTLAHMGHRILYMLMFIMPISGWLMSSAAGKNVILFGLPALTIPNIISVDKELAGLFNQIHEYCAYILIAAIIGHIFAALYHQFVHKNNLLSRMFP